MWASWCAGTATGVAWGANTGRRESQRAAVVDRRGRHVSCRLLQRTARMVRKALAAIAQTFRGIFTAVRARARLVLAVTAGVAVFDLVAPVVVLSIARRPADFFTFNPWLRRLPEYLASEDEPLGKKLSFLSNLALAW